MNRILLEAEEMNEDGRAMLDGRRAEHIVQVLGCHVGDTVRVGIINGMRGAARVEDIRDGRVQMCCILKDPPLPATGLSLLLALPRPKVLHRLWAPLASLGVDQIVLVNAAKVERNYFDTHWLTPSVYRGLLIEGLEQSGDTRLPRVRVCRRLKPFIEDDSPAVFGASRRVLCHPYAPIPLAACLSSDSAGTVMAIGPEGGWTDYEIDLMRQYGFECASFGERTLRTDTAVTAILGAALAARTPTTNEERL